VYFWSGPSNKSLQDPLEVGNNLPGINDNVTERGLEQNNGAYVLHTSTRTVLVKVYLRRSSILREFFGMGVAKPRLSIRHASCGKKIQECRLTDIGGSASNKKI